MKKYEETAREKIHSLTTEELMNCWEMTTDIQAEYISTVRGWLMDEIESRDSEGFNNWLESENCSDEELRDYIRA